MSSTSRDTGDLVDHYRPIGIRAVNAALVLKPKAAPERQQTGSEPSVWEGQPLPEGFHMPHSVMED